MELFSGGSSETPALPPAASAPEVAPELVAAVKAAVTDLHKHLEARAAQHPALFDHFKEVGGIVKALAGRFEESALGASVVGHVSQTEAQLVSGLVSKLTQGRAHLELGYLAELADNLTFAVLKAVV